MYIKSLLVAAGMCLVASTGFCQEAAVPVAASSPLTLTISSDKPVYEAGEEINIVAIIKNVGEEEIKIYSPGFWDVSEIYVMNSSGKKVMPKAVMADINYGAPLLSIPSQQSREHAFHNLRWNSLNNFWCFCDEAQLSVDHYSLYVTVTNPPKRVGAKYLSTDWYGTVTSNTITIEVKGKKQGAGSGEQGK